MKSSLPAFTALFLASVAFANYEVQTELEVPPTPAQTRVITLEEGKPATVQAGDLSVQLQASPKANDLVLIRAKVARAENGEEKLVTRSHLITHLGQAGEITEHTPDGALKFRLRLTPKKK